MAVFWVVVFLAACQHFGGIASGMKMEAVCTSET
jgi:hypothetical protein